jgi:hypothetical protein
MFYTVFPVRKESIMTRLMWVSVLFEEPMPDDDPQPITE